MRRDASRSAGTASTSAQAKGAFGRFAIALLGAFCAALLLGASAQAKAPTHLKDFSGGAAVDVLGLAVNEATGEVFVPDAGGDGGKGSINVFDAEGNELASKQIKGSETIAESFGFHAGESDIAVDNSGNPATEGNVYVVAGEGRPIFAFKPEGGAYKEIWEVPSIGGDTCGVGVDSAGNPWVADYESKSVTELKAEDGTLAGGSVSTATEGAHPCPIAFDSEDNLYVNGWHSSIFKYSPAPESKFLGTIEGLPASPTDVATDAATDRLYVAVGATGNYAFDSAGGPIPGNPFGMHPGGVTVNSATGKVYVSNAAPTKQVEIWQLPASFTLSVAKAGTGTGTVASTTWGIKCGAICSAEVDEGEKVKLTAIAQAGFKFTGWSGACTNATGACEVTMSAAKSVTATFALQTFTLSVTKVGNGEVESTPAGIACGATCSAQFSGGEKVSLAATPASGSKFTGWSGACSGSGACEVTISEAKSVTASFEVIPTPTPDPPLPPTPPVLPPPPPPTCATDASLCPKPPVKTCKKGFKKKKVKGKTKCVKVKKHHGKHHR